MRTVIFLIIIAIAMGFFMFLPAGPLGPQQAQASIERLPEPSSIILLGLGIAGLARYIRKRR